MNNQLAAFGDVPNSITQEVELILQQKPHLDLQGVLMEMCGLREIEVDDKLRELFKHVQTIDRLVRSNRN